jgi:hypothetical protein
MEKQAIEIKIHKFIMVYGPETLITWLDYFDKIITTKDYPQYRRLEREACKVCDISYADMKMFNDTPCLIARRIISFIACHELKMKNSSIAKFLNVSERMVNYYIKSAGDWIGQPKSNKEFIEAYNKVVNILKSA